MGARRPAAIAIGVGLAMLAIAALPTMAGASTITVTKVGDEPILQADIGDCALREAVQAANTNAPHDACTAGEAGPAVDTIVLPDISSVPDTFVLTNDAGDNTNSEGDLDLNTSSGPVAIEGRGPTVTTINAQDVDRVLDVSGTGTATLRDLTLTNGTITNTVSAHDDGGGIRSTGASLALVNTTVSNNTVTGAVSMRGGGIQMVSGNLSLSESTVTGNQLTRTGTAGIAAARGGGIGFQSAAGGTIDRSTVSGNTVTATDDDVTEGGGIATTDSDLDLTITNSTISGNTAGGATVGANVGGGISWDENGNDDELRLSNVTLSSNLISNAGLRRGGHLHVDGGTVSIAFTTFGTASATDGDGIYTATGTVQTRASLFQVGDEDCGGTDPTSLGHNVEQGIAENDCQFSQPTDVLTDNLLINALADYGGPTLTQELAVGSGVANLVPEASCLDAAGTPLTADQRGAPRPSPSSSVSPSLCDPGAFEFIRCLGQQAYLIGTDGEDDLFGTAAPEGALGLGGDDFINLEDGDDRVCAGEGDDFVTHEGSSGADGYDGEGGSDTIDLQFDGGTIDLASGVVTGPTLNAFLISFENARGGFDPDVLIGSAGPNQLDGAQEDDTITGGGGADTLIGSTGDDDLFARDGEADVVNCGVGDEAAGDTAQTDQLSLDSVVNCESVDALPEPPVFAPPITPAGAPLPAQAPARKKCKKGQKLKKGKCVKKKRKRREAAR